MVTQVVVATNPDRGVYLDHFMETVPSFFKDYVYVASTWGMEIGALQDALNTFRGTSTKSFAFMQDSMQVHNWGQFQEDISMYDSAYILPRPNCYAMVYDVEILEKMTLPSVGQDKESAIFYETVFSDLYENIFSSEFKVDMPILYPEMNDGEALSWNRFYDGLPERRLHLRSECGTISKYKATFR